MDIYSINRKVQKNNRKILIMQAMKIRLSIQQENMYPLKKSMVL